MFVFNIEKFSFYKCKIPFHNKSEMNSPQAEGNVNSRLYSRGRSSNKSHEECDAGELSSTLLSNNKNKQGCHIMNNIKLVLDMIDYNHFIEDDVLFYLLISINDSIR